MDKSRSKTGLHSAVQSAEISVGKVSDQKLPFVVAKSKITTPVPDSDLPSHTLAQVSIDKWIFTVYVMWGEVPQLSAGVQTCHHLPNYGCFEIKTTVRVWNNTAEVETVYTHAKIKCKLHIT